MANYVQPTTFTNPNAVLIADYLSGATAVPAYGNYNVPTATIVGGVQVSAALEIQSTTGAFLLPRMTTVERLALAVITNGMVVYDTTANANYSYENGAWGVLGGGDVVGPGASVTNTIPVFNGTTGKAIIDTLVSLNPITAIISGIGQAITAVGTAANPSYAFTGDTNTGFYQAGADSVGIATGGTTALTVTGATTNVNGITILGGDTGNPTEINARGTDAAIDLILSAKGSGFLSFVTNSSIQATVVGPAVAVNYLTLSGNTTGASAALIASGEANTGIRYETQGTGTHDFVTNGGPTNIQFQVQGVNAAVNFLSAFGSITGAGATTLVARGTDNNISINLIPKGIGIVQTANAYVVTTGTLPAATVGQISLGSAVAAGSTTFSLVGAGAGPITVVNPTAPDRTLAIVVNGTIYYLAAKTTND